MRYLRVDVGGWPRAMTMCPLRSTAAAASTVCVIALGIAACGSTHKASSQQLTAQQQVAATVRSYLRAQTSGDGAAACPLLTPSAQHQLTTLVMQASNGLLSSRPSCEAAVGLIKGFAPAQLLAGLSRARVENVQVTGNSATAEVVDGGSFPSQRVSLQKHGGAWAITGVPGLSASLP